MIQTKEVVENYESTLEELIFKACVDNKIHKGNLIDIKYNRSSVVEPYIDDDHIRDENSFVTDTTVSALIIWDDEN